MKKLVSLLFVVLVCVGFAACGSETTKSHTATTTTTKSAVTHAVAATKTDQPGCAMLERDWNIASDVLHTANEDTLSQDFAAISSDFYVVNQQWAGHFLKTFSRVLHYDYIGSYTQAQSTKAAKDFNLELPTLRADIQKACPSSTITK